MNQEPMKLIINRYRAIHSAEIFLNGLTVISGINGCGKSTISKMLYSIFEISNDFYPIVRINNNSRLNEYYDLLKYIVSVTHLSNLNIFDKENKQLHFELKQIEENLNLIKLNNELTSENIDNIIMEVNNVIDNLIKLCLDRGGKYRPTLNLIIRSKAIELGFSKKTKNNNETQEIQSFFEDVKKDIENIIRKIANETFITRPKEYLLGKLPSLFHTDERPELLELYENNTPIIGKNQKNINIPFFVKNIIYLDSPLAFQSNNPNRDHWDKINSFLIKRLPKDQLLPESNKFICDEILKVMGGRVNLDSNNKIIFTKETDNLKLELTDCATGIQSLSILFSLLNNNSINNNTLLILDEPEVHLHPQWITELSKILVLMRKHIKCHIFISTHSTDMIRGLKYLSKKEGIQENLNFFLAEESESCPSKFDYINLGTEIGSIFKCFNKSLEKLDAMTEE